jgi:uncharacterized membrane protein
VRRAQGWWDDERVEEIMGSLLRVGVLLAAAVVLAGGLFYLAAHGGGRPHYRAFRGEPSDLRHVVGIVKDAVRLSPRGVIQLGLLLLIATPVARVAFAVLGFALERDHMYVLVSLVVLSVLIFSLVGGHL